MNPPDYELLIIGGGPGGSSAAALACQRGLRTLVVEALAFPRFRIGESMLPASNEILRETGAWPKIEAAGFIRKNGALFYLANGTATKEIDFADSLVPGLDYTYQVERCRFDALLLDHARSLGAEVWMQSPVRRIEDEGSYHRIEIETTGGRRTVTARWVIDASGRESPLATEPRRPLDPVAFPKRLAIYTHFHGVARRPDRMAGATIVVRLEDGWFWIIPIDAERTSVGLVTTATALRASGLSPTELFHREVARSPRLRELMSGAAPAMEFRVTTDYSYGRRALAQDRLLLVGDAGGFFDPIFSSGVFMALMSARAAVNAIATAHAAARGLTPREQRRYTRHVKSHARVFERLIRAFYDRDSFSVFMCNEVPWDLTPGLTSIVAGHARLSWPLWWRFQIFLLVCRLQRRFTITPRVACEAAPLSG